MADDLGYTPADSTPTPRGEVRCAVNKAHETRQLHVTTRVGQHLWRIPVWVCVNENCMTHRGATSTEHVTGQGQGDGQRPRSPLGTVGEVKV